MKEIWNKIQAVLTVAGGLIGWFLGGFDGFLYALITFVAIDYITGVLCAIIEKNLCSKIGARGIFKKVLIFVLVGVGHVLDANVLGVVGNTDSNVLRTAVIFFYLSNEGISILENAAHIGLPIPKKLRDVLKQLHNRDKDGSQEGK
jgi:toxin secretion/phage lysis holin